jgi:ankyrin repeat protein
MQEQEDAVALLLEHSPTFLPDSTGETALDRAVKAKNVPITNRLIKAGADCNRINPNVRCARQHVFCRLLAHV